MKGYNLVKYKLHKEFNLLPSIEIRWCNNGTWKNYRYVNFKWFIWMIQLNIQ